MLLCASVVFTDPAWSQEPAETQAAPTAASDAAEFDKRSIALRTALHYDSSLDAPLNALVSLYQKADRSEELIGLYQAHTSQYPDDAGAHAVLIRIMNKLQRPEAAELIQATAQRLPDSSTIQYLLYEHLKRRRDERALEALSAAIDFETVAAKRDAFLVELLEQAGEANGRELATKHLVAQQQIEGQTAEALLALAQRMHRFGFNELSLATTKMAVERKPSPEVLVDLDMVAAQSLAALGDRKKAGERLDALLARMGPDHWARSKVMGLRVNLLASDADRKTLLDEAKARYLAKPDQESVALTYAELLDASDLRRQALKVLQAAAEAIPKSKKIEQEAIDLFERLGDENGLAKFLETRLAADKERPDLIWRLLKVQYLLGKSKEAEAHLTVALAALDNESERITKLLELARYLRVNSLPIPASTLFARVVEKTPERLDIRRELAETYIALEQRTKARALLADPKIMESAPIENLIDLAQFMISQNFFGEAQAALKARLGVEPNNFDIRLLLATVMGKTGEREAAKTLLAETRDLADTSARYREWLETNLEVAEIFDASARFFDQEQVRLLTGPESEAEWTTERIERFLAFCEIGERNELSDRVTQVLRNQLEDPKLPKSLSVRLRSLLVKSLERKPENAGEMEAQLKLLAQDDPARADDYRLRRVLLYHSLQRPDLAREALDELEIKNVSSVKTLRAAYIVLLEYDRMEDARVALRQVTEKEPKELINWEKRLSLLAALGEESEFRQAVRELLATADSVKLNGNSIRSLRLHLLDSYWRSIAELVANGSDEATAETLELLDSVERETVGVSDRLWGLWTRAYMLNQLGQKPGRDEAIEEIIALGSSEGNDDDPPKITFPDGLAISLPVAVNLLREPLPSNEAADPKRTQGPLFDLNVAWGFETDAGTALLSIQPAGPDTVLVLDNVGTIYQIDRTTGKLRWRERYGLPEAPAEQTQASGSGNAGLMISNGQFQITQQGAAITVQQLIAPYQTTTLGGGKSVQPIEDVSGAKRVRSLNVDPTGERFVLSFGSEVKCLSTKTGEVLWTADVRARPGIEGVAVSGATSTPDVHFSFQGDKLLCFAPAYGSASAFDAVSGKLQWTRQIGGDDSTGLDSGDAIFSLNTGANFSPDRFMIFGSESRILDAGNGQTVWTFDGADVRRFPLQLRREEKTETPSIAVDQSTRIETRSPDFLDHLSSDDPEAVKGFLSAPGALVAPAVQWSTRRLTSRGATDAVTAGDRLLLMESGGFREISLRLPLASKYHSVTGTFVGVVGQYAWFLEKNAVIQVALDDGKAVRFSAEEIAGEEGIRAVISGSRIYVIGSGGLLALNAWSGKNLAQASWPKEMQDYVSTQGGFSLIPGATLDYVWQGIIRRIPNGPDYLFPIRDTVDGDMLFTMINDGAFVAVRSREPNNPNGVK